MAGWDDAPHLSDETKAELLASTPEHLRDARSKGIPTLGSGAVFQVDGVPVDESTIKFDVFEFPAHWPRIAGMDFGFDHPTAAVWAAWDRDADCVYVYDAYRVSRQPVVVHAAAIKARKDWIPMAWPHDGLQHDKGSGEQLAEQYRDQGVNMLRERAQYEETGDESETKSSRFSVEAGIADMLDRMITGRLKIARHLGDWFSEFRMYHRDNGKIVKIDDDLLSATRYMIMMLRYAETAPRKQGLTIRRAGWQTA